MAKLKTGLSFKVNFENKPQEVIPLNAYLFNSKEEFIEKQPLKDNIAEFKNIDANLRGYRLLIAPPHPTNDDINLSFDQVKKRLAFEPKFEIGERGTITLSPIPERYIKFWFWIKCKVIGKVVKNFNIDGRWVEKPVCRARVHICEVDKVRIILPVIPDLVIDRIRDVLINPPVLIPRNPLIPIPPRPPFFDQVVTPKIDRRVFIKPGDINKKTNNLNLFPVKDKLKLTPLSTNVFKKELTLRRNFELPKLNEDLRLKLNSPIISVVRDAIFENIKILHPYFCHFPWIWPYFYSCTEYAPVYTDHNGNFDATIFYLPLGDKPDLYFWVEYEIDGVWTTIYKPSVPCNTYWDYECGKEIKITVTDPRVPICNDDFIPGEVVWVKTIGSSASVVHIEQNMAANTTIQGRSLDTIGLTDLFNAAGNYLRPFGSGLAFIVQFGSGLPANGLATHYRWSYKMVKDAFLNTVADTWHIINGAISKPYTIEYTDITGTHFKTLYYPLGPVEGLSDVAFKIPPANESAITADPSARWTSADTMAMHLNSGGLENGLYDLKLELLTLTGTTVNVATVPKNTFQTPLFNDSTESENAPETYFDVAGTTTNAFSFMIRVDNAVCDADIFNIKVYNTDGTINISDTECGFVKYLDKVTSDVEFSFRAVHLRNFAELAFGVTKGNTGVGIADAGASGMVIGDTSGYVLGADDTFRKKVKANILLGNCDKAAFAESLHVYAFATDGSYRLNYLDDGDIAAFALEQGS